MVGPPCHQATFPFAIGVQFRVEDVVQNTPFRDFQSLSQVPANHPPHIRLFGDAEFLTRGRGFNVRLFLSHFDRQIQKGESTETKYNYVQSSTMLPGQVGHPRRCTCSSSMRQPTNLRF